MTRVQFLASAGILLLTSMTRPAVGPNQPLLKWLGGDLSFIHYMKGFQTMLRVPPVVP